MGRQPMQVRADAIMLPLLPCACVRVRALARRCRHGRELKTIAHESEGGREEGREGGGEEGGGSEGARERGRERGREEDCALPASQCSACKVGDEWANRADGGRRLGGGGGGGQVGLSVHLPGRLL